MPSIKAAVCFICGNCYLTGEMTLKRCQALRGSMPDKAAFSLRITASLLQAELLPNCWAQIKMGIQSPRNNLSGILPSLLTCMLPYARARLPGIAPAPLVGHIQLQILPATAAETGSSETLQLFGLDWKHEGGKPKTTAPNSPPHCFPWSKAFLFPFWTTQWSTKLSEGKKSGKSHTYALKIHLRCTYGVCGGEVHIIS